MGPANKSQLSPSIFWLMGIPGLENLHVWIGIPFCSMYIVAVIGNVTILTVVSTERSLCLLYTSRCVYVAICDSLRHATILTHSRIAKMGIAVVLRGVGFFSPHPILLKQLPYCRTRIITHTYCEFMAVVKLACVDTGATKRYSLSVASVIGSCDGFFIAFSYVLILRAVFRLPSREA
ncbi:hypothetical protein A6R68_03749, partial [Neotoma lepida]